MSDPFQPVTLYAPDGTPYTAGTPVEATELRSAGYRDQPPAVVTVGAAGPDAAPEPFDPAEHSVEQVNAFLAEHPEARDAVVAAEQQGKNRTGIVGQQ